MIQRKIFVIVLLFFHLAAMAQVFVSSPGASLAGGGVIDTLKESEVLFGNSLGGIQQDSTLTYTSNNLKIGSEGAKLTLQNGTSIFNHILGGGYVPVREYFRADGTINAPTAVGLNGGSGLLSLERYNVYDGSGYNVGGYSLIKTTKNDVGDAAIDWGWFDNSGAGNYTTTGVVFNISGKDKRVGVNKFPTVDFDVLGRGNISDVNNNLILNGGNESLTGNGNVLMGLLAGSSVTTGIYNVAIGQEALESSTTSSYNVAIGLKALELNNGSFSMALGGSSYRKNTSGSRNTGVGYNSGVDHMGSDATAIGFSALQAAANADKTIAIGNYSLRYSTQGENIAIGHNGLNALGAGTGNISIGQNNTASSNGTNLVDFSNSIFLGNGYNNTESNLVALGNPTSKRLRVTTKYYSFPRISTVPTSNTDLTTLTDTEATDFMVGAFGNIFVRIDPSTAAGIGSRRWTIHKDMATVTTSGGLVSFDGNKRYGSTAAPVTATSITFDVTNADGRFSQKMIHNAGTVPTFPVLAVVFGTYVTGIDNHITFEYYDSNLVEVYISN